MLRRLINSSAVLLQQRHLGTKTVTLVPGDGVWPELLDHVRYTMNHMGAPVTFEEITVSGHKVRSGSSKLVQSALESITKNKVCIKGNISYGTKSSAGEHSFEMKMRKNLDLFANVVRIKSLPGVAARHSGIDIILIREQVEGEYSCLEHETVKGVVESLKIITAKESERIAKFAFDYAMKHDRKKVTAIHKANIMKLTDGLFLESCRKVSELYPMIQFDNMIVDNTCMQLTSHPQQFDVMILPNLYGSIVSNLCTGLVGGAGLVPGESLSSDVAIFEPGARHDFSSAQGQDIANPTVALLMAANMLDHLNLHEHADKLNQAVAAVLSEGTVKTQDIGGYATTTQFLSAVIKKIKV